MKKYSCLLLSLMLLFMTGCRSGENSSNSESGSSQPPITEVTDDDGIHDGKDYLGEENGYFVQNGSSEYKIVVSKDATGSELRAANEIQLYVNNTTGALLEIVSDENAS